jgi:hypothetical protein
MPQGQAQNTDPPQKEINDGTPIATRNAVLASKVAAATNRASEMNDTVAAQLYSPADNATAKMKIMGDPDFLMSSMANPRITANKLYSGDGSIDGRNGQVFAQISFATASDYEENGLLNVDDNIQFYKTDKVKKLGIDGIVYRVITVNSSFAKGKFEQNLDMVIVSENELVGETTQPEGGERAESSDSGTQGTGGSNKSKKTVTKGQKIRSQSHDKLNANSPTEKTVESSVEIRQNDDATFPQPDQNSDAFYDIELADTQEDNNSEEVFSTGIITVGDDLLAGNDNTDNLPEYEA